MSMENKIYNMSSYGHTKGSCDENYITEILESHVADILRVFENE